MRLWECGAIPTFCWECVLRVVVPAERRVTEASGFEAITLCHPDSPELDSSCACPALARVEWVLQEQAVPAGCCKGFPSSQVAFGWLFVLSGSF